VFSGPGLLKDWISARHALAHKAYREGKLKSDGRRRVQVVQNNKGANGEYFSETVRLKK